MERERARERMWRENKSQQRYGSCILFVLRCHGVYVVTVSTGIEVDCTDNDGWTPAHHAAEKGALSCLRLLASSGVDMCCTDQRGQQPCHLVAERDHLDCLKLLLKLGGAERTSRDDNGRTLLHMVSNHDEMK